MGGVSGRVLDPSVLSGSGPWAVQGFEMLRVSGCFRVLGLRGLRFDRMVKDLRI